MPKVPCSHCGESFHVPPSRAERYDRLYCSRECMAEGYSNRVEVECFTCGETIRVKPWRRNPTRGISATVSAGGIVRRGSRSSVLSVELRRKSNPIGPRSAKIISAIKSAKGSGWPKTEQEKTTRSTRVTTGITGRTGTNSDVEHWSGTGTSVSGAGCQMRSVESNTDSLSPFITTSLNPSSTTRKRRIT